MADKEADKKARKENHRLRVEMTKLERKSDATGTHIMTLMQKQTDIWAEFDRLKIELDANIAKFLKRNK